MKIRDVWCDGQCCGVFVILGITAFMAQPLMADHGRNRVRPGEPLALIRTNDASTIAKSLWIKARSRPDTPEAAGAASELLAGGVGHGAAWEHPGGPTCEAGKAARRRRDHAEGPRSGRELRAPLRRTPKGADKTSRPVGPLIRPAVATAI